MPVVGFLKNPHFLFSLHYSVVSLVSFGSFVLTALAIKWRWGFGRIRFVNSVHPLESNLPSVSIVVAARNEQENIGEACFSFLFQRYPQFDVVAVNDRSLDQTGAVLQSLSHSFDHFRVVTMATLPEGWMAKTHALYEGAIRSEARWLCFTDADVKFHPDLLTRVVSHAVRNNLDFVTVYPTLIGRGPLVKAAFVSFGMAAGLAVRPWKIRTKARDAFGIGAFMLVRKEMYEIIGTHKALKGEVVDDLALGRAVKKAGGRMDVLIGGDMIRVPWQKDLPGFVRGLEKNFFPSLGFSRVLAWGLMALFLAWAWGLWVALFYPVWWVKGLAAWGLLMDFLLYGTHRRFMGLSQGTYVFKPFGMTALSFALFRSMRSIQRKKGVYWRETFYPRSFFPKTTWRAVFRTVTNRY